MKEVAYDIIISHTTRIRSVPIGFLYPETGSGRPGNVADYHGNHVLSDERHPGKSLSDRKINPADD
jgi:hypothetical protein